MKITIKLCLTAFLAICSVALFMIMTRQTTGINPPIEASIASLRSADFQTSRQAQVAIVSAGKLALPLLLEQVRSSENQQQVALSFYLVGELDSATYAKALLETGVLTKLCLLLRYPNQEAIKRLSGIQHKELQRHLKECARGGTTEERTCLEKILEAMAQK